MKKFLIAFLLSCMCLMPLVAKASNESEICYEYLGKDGGGLFGIMSKYLSDGNGHWTENGESAFDFFETKMTEGKESRGVASITCSDLLDVCIEAKWVDKAGKAKCSAFAGDLYKAWTLGKKDSNKNGKKSSDILKSAIETYCENQGGVDFIMEQCENYKRDVSRPEVLNWQLYYSTYAQFNDCARLYGYAFTASKKGGCHKIKK